MPSKQTDKVFAEEQEHLTHTYSELERISKVTIERMEEKEAKAQEDKRSMAEELTVNLETLDDILETFASFASINQIVSSLNASHEADAQKLQQIAILLEQPYFAKISLRFPSSGLTKDLYIGSAGITDENHNRLIVDWRSPVAEVYYNQANGLTSYKANGRTIEVELLCRRQFDIIRDKLVSYFDTTVAIQDPLLLESISKHKSSKMQAITTTIQKEQNIVIRHEDVPTLLVRGIAGSGKTSVMMQRIAYLFYQMRDELSTDQVMLITPNPVFQEYIANVLPSMGESNPRQATWKGFLSSLLPEGRGIGRMDVDPSRFKAIEDAVANIVLESGDFHSIECEGRCLISASQIFRMYKGLERTPSLHGRFAMLREKIADKVNSKIASIAASDDVRDEYEAMSLDEQTRIFGAPLAALDDEEYKRTAKALAFEHFGNALKDVERDSWIDIDRLGSRLVGLDGLTSLEWIYLKVMVTGLCERDVRYVMIDEVQDCTDAMLIVASAYFPNAHYLLLGDPNQAISEKTASFDEIRSLFESQHGPVSECSLMTSYRSTPQITKMFAHLAEDEMSLNISSVQREDEPPRIEVLKNDEDHMGALRHELEDARTREGVTAFIVPFESDVRRMIKMLGEDAPMKVSDSDTLPDSGPVLLHLSLAKGLEFDHVVIPNASERIFPNDDLSRRRLYTTISRATHDLVVMSLGPLTSLLAFAY